MLALVVEDLARKTTIVHDLIPFTTKFDCTHTLNRTPLRVTVLRRVPTFPTSEPLDNQIITSCVRVLLNFATGSDDIHMSTATSYLPVAVTVMSTFAVRFRIVPI